MSKYTRLFIDESRLYLQTIGRTLSGPRGGDGEGLSDSHRLAHSIKGMALFEEQSAIAGLAYALEQGLEEMVRDGGSPPLTAQLCLGVELLRTMIDHVERDGSPRCDASPVVEAIVRELK